MKKLCLLLCAILAFAPPFSFAQVSPQIQGAGAPSNPCANGGQDYVDQTNHVLYTCPSAGSNWVNRGIGQPALKIQGTPTAGNCSKWIDQATLGDAGAVCGGGATKVFSSAYTNATTTLSNVTGLSLSVAANTSYVITCNLIYSVDTSTATPNWAFTWPASPTSAMWSGWQTGATAVSVAGIIPVTVSGTASANSSATTITTNDTAVLTFPLQNGANAGTVQLQAKANGAGTLTILAGSSCVLN
jgi:hypothetical protein